jgi:CRP/FNR family transcriptional regulator
MNDCSSCIVRNRAICSSLTPDELALLGKMGRRQKVKAGHTLLWEGDDAPVVANVLEGVLKLVVAASDGREQIVGIVFPSDFIGRPFGKESPYSVTAMTDAEVCIFNRNAFDDFASEHPDLQQKLLRRTLDELDRARHWMMLLGPQVRHREGGLLPARNVRSPLGPGLQCGRILERLRAAVRASADCRHIGA